MFGSPQRLLGMFTSQERGNRLDIDVTFVLYNNGLFCYCYFFVCLLYRHHYQHRQYHDASILTKSFKTLTQSHPPLLDPSTINYHDRGQGGIAVTHPNIVVAQTYLSPPIYPNYPNPIITCCHCLSVQAARKHTVDEEEAAQKKGGGRGGGGHGAHGGH